MLIVCLLRALDCFACTALCQQYCSPQPITSKEKSQSAYRTMWQLNRQYVALCAGSGNQKCAAAWMLVTEPSLRKRLGPLPALLESAGCHDQHCAVYLNPSIPTTMRAMWQHKTQRRWYAWEVSTGQFTDADQLVRKTCMLNLVKIC